MNGVKRDLEEGSDAVTAANSLSSMGPLGFVIHYERFEGTLCPSSIEMNGVKRDLEEGSDAVTAANSLSSMGPRMLTIGTVYFLTPVHRHRSR